MNCDCYELEVHSLLVKVHERWLLVHYLVLP